MKVRNLNVFLLVFFTAALFASSSSFAETQFAKIPLAPGDHVLATFMPIPSPGELKLVVQDSQNRVLTLVCNPTCARTLIQADFSNAKFHQITQDPSGNLIFLTETGQLVRALSDGTINVNLTLTTSFKSFQPGFQMGIAQDGTIYVPGEVVNSGTQSTLGGMPWIKKILPNGTQDADFEKKSKDMSQLILAQMWVG